MRGPRFPRPPSMRRVVVVVPSLFTLFNLFFGIWSMVLASRGEFYRASWYIFFAGILDALDGRVARLSNTGSRFGAELDSLVDVVSFGVAPAPRLPPGARALGLATIMFTIVFGILEHDVFFFPLGITYMSYGVLRAALLGLLTEREDDEEAEIAGPIVITDGPTLPPFDE